MQMSQLKLQNLFNGPNGAHLNYYCTRIIVELFVWVDHTHANKQKKILGIFCENRKFLYRQFILLCNVIVTLSTRRCVPIFMFVFVIYKFTIGCTTIPHIIVIINVQVHQKLNERVSSSFFFFLLLSSLRFTLFAVMRVLSLWWMTRRISRNNVLYTSGIVSPPER